MTFDDFYFEYPLLDGLDAMGFYTPTPIQEKAIPIILDHYDLIACAQTGTGKTAAYVLPILNKIAAKGHKGLNTLILVPTRELAQQIDQQVQGFSYYIDVSSTAIFGGGDGHIYEQQRKALLKGADIIISTPGRLISQLVTGEIKFNHLEHLVLDEADKMLDMGFYEDIVKIIGYLPKDRQTLMFSATMPPKIRTLANKILHEPEQISLSISKPAAGINQLAYMTYDGQKLPLIHHLFKETSYQSVIIFASTKEKVKNLQFEFKQLGLKAKSFHSDLEQKDREEIMNEFKNKKLNIIIGTDILSRGIDVQGISFVINYDIPKNKEVYLHRIGRSGRYGKKGVAINFITDDDIKDLRAIEMFYSTEIEEMPNDIESYF